jgi:hypothetical protein
VHIGRGCHEDEILSLNYYSASQSGTSFPESGTSLEDVVMHHAETKAQPSSILYCFLDDLQVVLCQIWRIISLVSCERLNNDSGLDHRRSISL